MDLKSSAEPNQNSAEVEKQSAIIPYGTSNLSKLRMLVRSSVVNGLFIAVVLSGLWLRSYWFIDMVGYGKQPGHGVTLISGKGQFVVGFNGYSNWAGFEYSSCALDGPDDSIAGAIWFAITGDNSPEAWYTFGGFLFGWNSSTFPFYAFGLPAWFPVLLGIVPILRLWRLRKRQDYRELSKIND